MSSQNERNGSNYVPGYEPVLLRSEIKKRLKEFRFAKIGVPKEMHIERHMVTAAVELVLTNKDAQQQWLENVHKALHADIDQSMAMAVEQ